MDTNFGTLIRCFENRNFFFIRDDESGRDIFTHISGFAAKVALPKGTRVRYRIVPNPRQIGSVMAVDVEPIAPVVSTGVRP